MSALLWLTLSLAPAEPPPDDERPEPTVGGPQYRMYRRVEQLVDRDLGSAWESYTGRIRDGTFEPFIVYARRRFRTRRNIGIGVTAWGVAALGVAAYLWVEVARADCDGVVVPCAEPVGLGIAAGLTTAASIGALVTGALLWRRWGAAVRELKDAGLARRPGVAPLVLPRGGGLGLSFAF